MGTTLQWEEGSEEGSADRESNTALGLQSVDSNKRCSAYANFTRPKCRAIRGWRLSGAALIQKLKAMMKCFSWNLTVHFLLCETCAKTERGIFWLSPFVSSGTFQLLYHPTDPFLIWVYELQRGRAHILHTKWLAPGSLEKSKCARSIAAQLVKEFFCAY